MTTVAIISEYNPFHLGHEYQINEIKRQFGSDTAIIAIMSGNYTQRGEIAIAEKYLRAKLAVLSGVNLVLELPFPYSMSSAEFFAKAGVHIANSLGCVDYLSFGSEIGSVDSLCNIAKNLLSDEYTQAFKKIKNDSTVAAIGYAALCERAYNEAFSEDIGNVFTPNNILALEYIKALIRTKSSIKPHTVLRKGGAYNSENVGRDNMPSAMAIRNLMSKNDISAFDYMPKFANFNFSSAYGKEFPTDASKLDNAILANIRLNNPSVRGAIHDADGGLYNRLYAMSFKADSIQSLIALAETKKYTTARIKRAIWYSFLGVTSSDVKTPPEFTRLLAFDDVGQQVLKKTKGLAQISLITKPSKTTGLSDTAKRQKELSDVADSIFQLTKPTHFSGKYSILRSPFVKKQK